MKKAFTLIEMLIVVAILVIIVSLIMSTFRMVRGKSYAINCLGNLRQLQMGSLAYAQEYNGRYVPVGFCVAVNAYMAYASDWPANTTFLSYSTGDVVNADIGNFNKKLACPLLRERAVTSNQYNNLLRKSYGYNPQDYQCLNASFIGQLIGPKTTDVGVGQRVTFMDSMGWLLVNSWQIGCYYNGVDDSYRDGQGPGAPSAGVALRHSYKANLAFGDGRAGAYGYDSTWGKYNWPFNQYNNGLWDKHWVW